MHKLAKAGIAGVIGTALLLGGAGSFALWNTSASITPGNITAGSLSLAAGSDGAWSNSAGPIDPAAFRMVPGDVLTYKQTLQVTAVGDDLRAALTFTGPTGTGGLAPFATVSPITVTSSNTAVVAGDGKVTGTHDHVAATTVLATLTVTLPSTVSGTQGQGTELDLSSAAFTLTQTS